MSFLLLIDVLDLIIDELAATPQSMTDLKSCSLANKTFVKLCQKLIFKTVDLCNGAETERLQKQYRLFVGTLASKPELGKLVRNLNYHFDNSRDKIETTDRHFQDVIVALQSMTKLTKFSMDYHRDSDSPMERRQLRFGDCAVDWQKAVMSMLHSPSSCLRSLTIHRIHGFPLSLCLGGASLEELALRETSIPDTLPDWFDITSCPLTTSDRDTRLTKVTFKTPGDIAGLTKVMSKLHQTEPSQCTTNLFRIVDVELEFIEASSTPSDTTALLSFVTAVESLKRLKFQILCFKDQTLFVKNSQLPFPFLGLNPHKISANLFQLDLSVLAYIHDCPATAQTPKDPWLGLCTVLPLFTTLRVFHLSIAMILSSAEVHVLQAFHKEEWAALDEVLTSKPLNLAEVAIKLDIESFEEVSVDLHKRRVEEFSKYIKENISSSFQRLRRSSRVKGGSIDFTFSPGLMIRSEPSV